ncbi:MAG: HypC/HybG/HupF family hydrogenase formation chaperone [Pirellulaceae bacterium]|nr:HypC/HybG/HupF family hydrogenase formation chaperone [Pirellulaceae bacterium]MCU0981513.1 HypC/HybG/HupF family hydrogenase formation chaperone [Pirellulaceae bacterium]
MGRVEFGGIVKEVCLAYVPETQVGDYVLVHVGFAISKIDEAEAREIFSYIEQIEQLGELQDMEPPLAAAGPPGVEAVT